MACYLVTVVYRADEKPVVRQERALTSINPLLWIYVLIGMSWRRGYGPPRRVYVRRF